MRRAVFSTAVIVALVVNAACGGLAAPGSPSGRAAESSAAPIKIGLLEALTGPIARVGKDNMDGFKLYLSSLNDTIAGRPIEVIVADTTGQPDVALAKVRDLVENQKVDLIAGVNQTPECYAVAQFVQKAQVPLVVTGNCGATYVTVDAQYNSPYLIRATANSGLVQAIGNWVATQGYKKAVLFTADYAGGLELNDIIGGAFVRHGGTIVQELHAPVGTTDFGPYLTQLHPEADVILAFEPGADGLRFGQQYPNYAGRHKAQVVDILGQITGGANLAQLGDAAVGIIATSWYSEASDTPQAQQFAKAVAAAYPDRALSADLAIGYAGAQVIAAAIAKVNGNVQDRPALLNALYATNIDTPRGNVTFDEFHDVIGTVFVYQIVKDGDKYRQKLLQSAGGAKQLANYTLEEMKAAHFGKLKGKWVGMTKEQLGDLLK